MNCSTQYSSTMPSTKSCLLFQLHTGCQPHELLNPMFLNNALNKVMFIVSASHWMPAPQIAQPNVPQQWPQQSHVYCFSFTLDASPMNCSTPCSSTMPSTKSCLLFQLHTGCQPHELLNPMFLNNALNKVMFIVSASHWMPAP